MDIDEQEWYVQKLSEEIKRQNEIDKKSGGFFGLLGFGRRRR